MRAYPSFGMTTTQAIRNNFALHDSNVNPLEKQSHLAQVLTQTSSAQSQILTQASALPMAKCFPVGSNLIQIRLDGWAG